MTLIDREPRSASGSPTPTHGTTDATADRPRPAPLGDAPVDRWNGTPRPTTPAAW
ncbi:monooxygenase, partial [Clavibacter californiensis]